MNEKFIQLFEKSNMTKAEFCRVIGLKKQNEFRRLQKRFI